MSPQRKGVLPPKTAQRLAELAEQRAQVDADLKAAVVAALKKGGSVREVMKATGLPSSTVMRWGHDGGWPTAEQRAAREEARERQRAWARTILGLPPE